MSPKRKTTAKPKVSAIADTPATVRVQVVREYVGSPRGGEVIEVTRTPHLDKLIRAGFYKAVR